MRSIAISGSAGKDIQIKIDSVDKLDPPFKKYLRKTLAYSKIPEYYGPDWDMERVFSTLSRRSIKPPMYSYGGRAPHVAYGIAKLGGDVRLITVFGDDLDEPYVGFFGGGYQSHLLKSGVKMDTIKVEIPDDIWKNPDQMRKYLEDNYAQSIYQSEAIQVVGKETSTIVCTKDQSGIDFFYIDDIKGAGYIEVARPVPSEVLRKVDIVFVTTSETPFMEGVVLKASELGKEILMDIGSYGVTENYLKKTVPLAKVIFGNESEIKQVRDALNAGRIEDIFDLTETKFPEAIILEDKFQGLVRIFYRKGGDSKIGPIPLNKIGNSVGCCDGIAAGFLFLYQNGFSLETCARAGLVICSTIWEVEGVQEGMPAKSEFYKRFSSLFPDDTHLTEIEKILRPA